MVEQAILMIIYLLFYGLVGMTIIAFALIIAIVVILSKYKKHHICSAKLCGVLLQFFVVAHIYVASHFLTILYTGFDRKSIKYRENGS